MQDGLSERLRADFATMEPVYVDGVVGYLNLGANYVTYYFRFGASTENGELCKLPALAIVRPVTSLLRCPSGCAVQEHIRRAVALSSERPAALMQ